MIRILLAAIFLTLQSQTILLPIAVNERININEIQLTRIGHFGLQRIARPGIPAHLHTGIDILPPNRNYQTKEFIYPIATGKVISVRTDGPFAQVIIEHQMANDLFWSVYEHVAEIQVDLFQPVSNSTPIARFFMTEELDHYGYQFNHFHFEILKQRPVELPTNDQHPERRFGSYTLTCKSNQELNRYFYDPLSFLRDNIEN